MPAILPSDPVRPRARSTAFRPPPTRRIGPCPRVPTSTFRAAGAADDDLELLETRTLDGRTQELVYRPTLH